MKLLILFIGLAIPTFAQDAPKCAESVTYNGVTIRLESDLKDNCDSKTPKSCTLEALIASLSEMTEAFPDPNPEPRFNLLSYEDRSLPISATPAQLIRMRAEAQAKRLEKESTIVRNALQLLAACKQK